MGLPGKGKMNLTANVPADLTVRNYGYLFHAAAMALGAVYGADRPKQEIPKTVLAPGPN